MGGKADDNEFSTRAIHVGTKHYEGSVNTPIFQSSTYKLTEETYAGWAAGAQHTLIYSRLSSVNSEAVAEKLASLENAEDGEVFASGMAAISTTLLGLLSNGDHIVASSDVYGGTYGLITEDLPRFGIEVSMADMRDVNSYEAAIQPNTKMLYIETLTNPVLKVCDIEAFSKLANKNNLILVVDNTFASPYLQNPITLGADIVMHSATKYLAGHSDVVLGALMLNDDEMAEKLYFIQNASGAVPGPQDCFLTLRGIKTLHVRMQRHCENAHKVANFLNNHEMVEKVYWPGLDSHKNHDVAKKQMSDFGGMLSFRIKDFNKEQTIKFLEKLHLFTLAESLGGVESLCGHPATMTHASIPVEEREKSGVTDSLIRLSVGIEDVDDLIKDLQKERKMALIFISHDLDVVGFLADRVVIMYAGEVVEDLPVEQLESPAHPYTIALQQARPRPGKANVDFDPIPGTLPQPRSILIGCRFKDRCSKANKQCEINPPWQGHNHQPQVRCWHPKI